MKIVFTKHATKDKFPMLAKHKFHLKEQDIVNVLENPEHEDKQSDKPNIIASASLDKPSTLLVDQIRSIDQSRLSKRIGKLTPKKIEAGDRALSLNLGLEPID